MIKGVMLRPTPLYASGDTSVWPFAQAVFGLSASSLALFFTARALLEADLSSFAFRTTRFHNTTRRYRDTALEYLSTA